MPEPFTIDPDIRRAWTPPADLYSDAAWFGTQRERVLARAWHYVGHTGLLPEAGSVLPLTLLPGCLDEPLLLTRDLDGTLRCLSNVCTHRGNLVADGPACLRALRCRYHGRRFDLDGRMLSMPQFEAALDFPAASDDLPTVALAQWGPLLFVSLDPALPFEDLIAPIRQRVDALPLARSVADDATTQTYGIAAHWALYVDNFLEGFHIPYVHAGLADVLDYGAYRTETFAHASLQMGVAAPGETAFDLPAGHPDAGVAVAAWYFWLFPTTMLNIYPWGLSLNAVRPRASDHTDVLFVPFVWDATQRSRGAGADLDRVEREDEVVVQSVQHGVRSRLYDRGRYSPTMEVGVHHFHRLLAAALAA